MMNTNLPDIQAATPGDLDDIVRLLQQHDLPSSDIDAGKLPWFLAIRDANGQLLACGGIERCGDVGLLRSLAVSETLRGTGLGARLVAALEQLARDNGIDALYLLTMTASDYFPRFGYRAVAREALPDAVRASSEFTELCPATAQSFGKHLK